MISFFYVPSLLFLFLFLLFFFYPVLSLKHIFFFSSFILDSFVTLVGMMIHI